MGYDDMRYEYPVSMLPSISDSGSECSKGAYWLLLELSVGYFG